MHRLYGLYHQDLLNFQDYCQKNLYSGKLQTRHDMRLNLSFTQGQPNVFSSDKTDDRYILLKTYYYIFSPFEISETLPHAPISRFRFSISCSYFFNCSSAFRSSFMISALKLNVILALNAAFSMNLYRSTRWLIIPLTD